MGVAPQDSISLLAQRVGVAAPRGVKCCMYTVEMKRMQFTVSGERLRSGVLSWEGGSITTPTTTLYTRAAAVPHITPDLLGDLISSRMDPVHLCLPSL